MLQSGLVSFIPNILYTKFVSNHTKPTRYVYIGISRDINTGRDKWNYHSRLVEGRLGSRDVLVASSVKVDGRLSRGGFACVPRRMPWKRIERRVVVWFHNKTGQSQRSLSLPLSLFHCIAFAFLFFSTWVPFVLAVVLGGLVGLAGFRRPRGFFFLVFRSSLVNLCIGDQLHGKRGRPFSRSWGRLLSGDGRRSGARQSARRAENAALEETNTARPTAREQGLSCPCLQLAQVVARASNTEVWWVLYRGIEGSRFLWRLGGISRTRFRCSWSDNEIDP